MTDYLEEIESIRNTKIEQLNAEIEVLAIDYNIETSKELLEKVKALEKLFNTSIEFNGTYLFRKIMDIDTHQKKIKEYKSDISSFNTYSDFAIFNYIDFYRRYKDRCFEKECRDVLEPLMIELHDTICSTKYYTELTEEQNKGYVKAIISDNRWKNLRCYERFVTPEANLKAIKLNFIDIRHVIDLYDYIRKIQYIKKEFKYGYGEVSLDDREIGYGFEGLQFIFEGPIIKNICDILNVKYEFKRIRCYEETYEDWVNTCSNGGGFGSGNPVSKIRTRDSTYRY